MKEHASNWFHWISNLYWIEMVLACPSKASHVYDVSSMDSIEFDWVSHSICCGRQCAHFDINHKPNCFIMACGIHWWLIALIPLNIKWKYMLPFGCSLLGMHVVSSRSTKELSYDLYIVFNHLIKCFTMLVKDYYVHN